MNGTGRGKHRPSTRSEEFERARAKIRAARVPAKALIEFRYDANPATLLRTGKEFATHPAYKTLTWRAPFPRLFSELAGKGYPYYLAFEKELGWAVSVISAYASQISRFIQLRRSVEHAILCGNLDSANAILDDVEDEFGVSLWLVNQRINYNQLVGGLSARNRYAQDVLKDDRAPVSIKYAIAWLSYRAGADISSSQINRLLDDVAPLRFGGDHILHLFMGRCPPVDPTIAGQMISYTDAWPAIDRFQTLLGTISALLASGELDEHTRDFVAARLGDLDLLIPDPVLGRLCFAWGGTSQNLVPDEFLADLLEMYSKGEYEPLVHALAQSSSENLSIEAINLGLRAASLSGLTFELPSSLPAKSLLAEISADLALLINFADDAVDARLRLSKLVLNFSDVGWSSSLALILERQRHDERVFKPTRLQAFHGLRCFADQPLLAFALPGPRTTERYLHLLTQRLGGSRTAEHLLTMCDPLFAPSAGHAVPEERGARLAAFTTARAGDYVGAARELESIKEVGKRNVATQEAALLLVHCYLRLARLADAADLAAALFVRSRYFGLVLPVQDLIDKLLTHHNEPLTASGTRGKLSAAIIFDVYSRYVASNRDAERADAYKDVLRKFGVLRASDLGAQAAKFDREQLIYFLRYICVPDVLDQSLALESTRAVEDERAAILVLLSEMSAEGGRPPPPAFKDELREIRTRQVVRETTLRLDQSKVYVNIDGIKRAIDVTMREHWNRYQLSVQQEGGDLEIASIERLVRTALGDQVTFITLNNPLSERGALFRRMVAELRDEFAFNKEFGLNSNLSTNIRHGYVLRELRGPLVSHNLTTNLDSESGSYHLNAHWLDRLHADEKEKSALSDILVRFSTRVDDQIDVLNRQLLRIRSEKNPDGLFEYGLNESVLQSLEHRWSKLESYEEFVDAVFDTFWQATERNLARVRDRLLGPVLTEFSDALSELERNARLNGLDLKLPGLISAVSMVRPEMRSAVERVASWFTLSGNNEYQDFDLEIAFQAGLQTVKTYYSNVEIAHRYIANRPIILRGWCLPIFARLFFLTLDNAATHGTRGRADLDLEVKAELADGMLWLKVSNDLPAGHDVERLSAVLSAINADYGKPKAVELLGEEGGSGYPKIWKLLYSDLHKEHELRVLLDEDRRFVVELMLSTSGIV